jgi:diketogulonate reductase-like aldo/keto reductase
MEDSMRKLRVKVMDLMQVHNLLDVDTHLATLEAWKKEGRVRYVGVTHYTASGAEDVARLVDRRPVDFVQINYSVAERDAEKRLLPLCRDKGIAVIANRPFAGGELFRQLRARPIPPWAGEIDCASWAQLMLKFVVSHPAMTCAIPASAKPEHTRDNMAAGLGRMPDAATREKIAAEILRG